MPLIPERFALRAAADPGALAVVQGDRRVTYAELDERADEIAARLRQHAVTRGDVVMVHLERSPDLIAAMFAVWKVGAVYLPTDPGMPVDRTKRILSESKASVVVTDGAPLPDIGPPGIDLRTRSPKPTPRHADTSSRGDDPAYLIYTSGSTGAPKGVEVEHASLAYLLDHINDRYGITADDRVLQFAATTFDTSIEQILVTLLNGATLVLPDRLWAAGELAEELHRYDVTVMDLTPSYWRAFLAELRRDPRDLPVRLTVVGGSAVHAADCRTALELLPRTRLVNAYGLTEVTITSCTKEITYDALPEQGVAPVGRPLPGTSVHVLDEALQPLPGGSQGEVYLAGPGLARGYVSPGAAGTRFVEGTGSLAGQRLYRTGDLGRLLDGELVVTGRVDRQLKLRGFRVEPAEVEEALTAHPGVADAAVKTFEQHGDLALAAYYTVSRSDRPDTGELREHLRERLPSYMVPTAFVALPAMPVKPNGKIDLDALPEVPAARPSSETRDDPTREDVTPVERAVAGIWRNVLSLDHVARTDSFFALGGNSLLAAQLLAKVRASLGIMITQVRPLIRTLLDGATLQEFALAVASARAGTFADTGAKAIDFEAESALGLTIGAPVDPADWQTPRTILLTGATGFLGVYLLRELLATTEATVHCLVRAQNPEHAMRRVQDNARHYFQDDLAEYRDRGRIVAIPGDLAEPGLGLSEEHFDDLAATVDVIHHPGGLVNFIYPYSHMRAANVEGTREIIRLAARYRHAPIHYTSTMAVISGFGTAGVRHVDESTPLAHADRLSVGYVESKWVAEALLRNAAEAGLPVAVYRAADISGDQRSGAWNTSTEMCAMKRFIVDTGTSPLAELPLDYTPVDVFAAAVAHTARTRPADGRVYHLTNPGKVNVARLTDRLRAHGHTIRDVAWSEWLEHVVRIAVEEPDHPMTPFAPLFIDRCSTGEMSVAEMYLETTFPVFSRHHVDAALEGSGIRIPPVDDAMLDRYIRYLTDIDFL
ncbi:amino acid adenylation domain-containing protein [Streptomyces sp. NPDC012825]|uniref:amino acid adenylation domain-containing protein n=1 Tax=Streptomyces sp. NPDC012825 TaxID=3364851 RepID=UPI0036816295